MIIALNNITSFELLQNLVAKGQTFFTQSIKKEDGQRYLKASVARWVK